MAIRSKRESADGSGQAAGSISLGADRRSAEVLRRLDLDINRRLDGILHGDHRGLVPGHGSEPGEAREYQPGDDVRRIDWSVSARMNTTHIRESIADRELETWIVADRSASLDFGTVRWEKRDLVLAAAGGVGFLTSRGGNRIGAVIAASDGVTTVPARTGRKHLMAVLDRIQRAIRVDTEPALDLAALMRRSSSVARRRALVVVISDFLDSPDTWRHELAMLEARHQVLCIEVVDPRELELPKAGILTLIDTETGRTREIDTNNRKLRDNYRVAAAEQRSSIASAITSTGAQHLQLRTDGDWLLDLARHVSTTKRSRVNIGGTIK